MTKKPKQKEPNQVLHKVLPDKTATVRKKTPIDLNFFQALNSTMNEWQSDEDELAYKDL